MIIMSTSCSLGFSRQKDLEDFSGVYINYDGYPSDIITKLAFINKIGRFSDLVKEIKNAKSQMRELKDFEEILEGDTILDPFPPGGYSKKVTGRDDFFYANYGYVIKSNSKITMYENSYTESFTFNFDKINWSDVYKRILKKTFEAEKHQLRNIFYIAFRNELSDELNLKRE